MEPTPASKTARQFIRTTRGEFIPTDEITRFAEYAQKDKGVSVIAMNNNNTGYDDLVTVATEHVDAMIALIVESTATVINPVLMYQDYLRDNPDA